MLLAGPISHSSIQHMDFVEILNILLDLSTFYFIFLILVGVELYLCTAVIVDPECYDLFSGVKLSISVLCYFCSTELSFCCCYDFLTRKGCPRRSSY